ncbi:hypothetical protein ACLQ3H_16805 [Micromonospora saelicesensis]|uniref:hypothetical protein n=1 Tax=Micromonospora saelicesensis TaxID=285676 RepID=UPI003CE7B6B1
MTSDLRFSPDTALLSVKLLGPREVERYEWIRVEIRNDKDRVFPGTHRGYSEEEWRRQVWGPFRLRPGVDGADRGGRTATQEGRAVTDSWLFTLDRSTAPSWYSGGDAAWRKDYHDIPIRLRIEIGLGEQSWVELLEAPPPARSAYEDGGLTVV